MKKTKKGLLSDPFLVSRINGVLCGSFERELEGLADHPGFIGAQQLLDEMKAALRNEGARILDLADAGTNYRVAVDETRKISERLSQVINDMKPPKKRKRK